MDDKQKLEQMATEALEKIIDSIAWDDQWGDACRFLRAKIREAYILGKLKQGVEKLPEFKS